MMAHSPGVQISSKAASGGIMEGLKRSVLCGESFFSTTYTAPAEGGWGDIAGVLPGGMLALEIQASASTARSPSWTSLRASVTSSTPGTSSPTTWGCSSQRVGRSKDARSSR